MEYNVVVEVDAPSDRIGSILLPPSAVDKERLQADEGWLVADQSRWRSGSTTGRRDRSKPEIGDRVLIGRYAGVTREKDGTLWRVVKDKDIIAVIEPRSPRRWPAAA